MVPVPVCQGKKNNNDDNKKSSLFTDPQLWSQALGGDRKNEIANTSGFSPGRVAGVSLVAQEDLRLDQLRWLRHPLLPPGCLREEVI